MMRNRLLFAILSLGLIGAACRGVPEATVVPNQPPETHLFIEGTVDTTGARQRLCWYGNDPDGEVVGFFVAVDDTAARTFTTTHCSTFVFTSGQEPVFHTVYVWAQDNQGALDPTPATLTLPVVNTPPTVAFLPGSLPQDTVFPVVTFYWEGHDEDGDETILGYYWWLDTDADSFSHFISAETTRVTLRNLPEGLRVFHVRALDNAGALSAPRADTFVVKPAVGTLLLVDDEPGDTAGIFYRHILDSLGISYSVWRVEDGLPYSPIDLNAVVNELGFEVILWYTGATAGHFTGAQGALATFLDRGGHLYVSNQRLVGATVTDFVRDYLHVARPDSGALDKFLLPIWPLVGEVPGYPDTLQLSVPILSHITGFVPDSLSEGLYRFPDDVTWSPAFVSLRYPAGGPAQVVFLGFPLQKLNGNGQASEVLAKILQEFGVSGR